MSAKLASRQQCAAFMDLRAYFQKSPLAFRFT